MTQTDELLLLLRRRGNEGLTPLDALYSVGCFRLAARVYELRKDGYNITDLGERTPSGKRIARYVLREEGQLRWTR